MLSSEPCVLIGSAYPLIIEAIRHDLRGFYAVQNLSIAPNGQPIAEQIAAHQPVAIGLDSSLLLDPLSLNPKNLPCGLIFMDKQPNIFRIQRYLEGGVLAYLYLGDALAGQMRLVVDSARRGQRFLSPSILSLYQRYSLYRGIFSNLTERQQAILQLLGEDFSAGEIAQRLGLSPDVVYSRLYRLRKQFGVQTNAELLEIIQALYTDEPVRVE